MKRNRVNVLTVINSASNITTETIDGREHIIVRGVVPIVDDIVMNRRFYPSAEIKKGYNTLEHTPMPLDHPKIDGKNVSASDPRAVNSYHVGAWFQNATHGNGRVSGDMYVDRRYAENSEKGLRLLERLDAMAAGENVEPIHISTGLGFRSIATNGESKGKRYREIVTEMQFDHTAILLDVPGAGTPEEGVGIFVNADGSESEIEIVSLTEAADGTKETWWKKTKFYFTNASNYSFDEISAAIRNKMSEGKPDDYYFYPDVIWPEKFVYEEGGKYFQQKYVIDDDGKAVFVGERTEVVRKPAEYEEIKTNEDENPMKVMIINALKAAGKSVDGLSDDQLFQAYNEHLAEAGKQPPKDTTTNNDEVPVWAQTLIGQVKDLGDKFAANNQKDIDTKRSAVKVKFGLTDTAVNSLDGAALDEMYASCIKAAPLNTSFVFNADGDQDDQWKDYSLNIDVDGEEK